MPLSTCADSLVTSVPSEVHKCTELPRHLCSEISFLRTCNIPNLISYVYRIALSKRFAGCVSTIYMVVKLHVHWNKHFLNVKFSSREHCGWLTSQACINTLINETSVIFEATTLSIWDIAIPLEEPHKLCRRPAIRSPLVWTYVPYR